MEQQLEVGDLVKRPDGVVYVIDDTTIKDLSLSDSGIREHCYRVDPPWLPGMPIIWFPVYRLTLVAKGYVETVRQMRQYFNQHWQDVCIGCGDQGLILKGNVNLDTQDTQLSQGFCEFCCPEDQLTEEDREFLQSVAECDLW